MSYTSFRGERFASARKTAVANAIENEFKQAVSGNGKELAGKTLLERKVKNGKLL